MLIKYCSEVGLNTEKEIIALSLEQQGFSKSAIKRLAIVERLHKTTSFIDLQTLANMIRFNTVKNIQEPLVVQDVDNYSNLVQESDYACIEGKMRAATLIVFDYVVHDYNAC